MSGAAGASQLGSAQQIRLGARAAISPGLAGLVGEANAKAEVSVLSLVRKSPALATASLRKLARTYSHDAILGWHVRDNIRGVGCCAMRGVVND